MRKVALITGGSRGIGLAIALGLAENGYDLAINGTRARDQLGNVLRDMEEKGARVVYCRGDIGIDSEREFVIGKVKDEFGKLNLLVNNAGVAPLTRVNPLELTEESYERVMNINLKAPYFLTQSAAKFMIDLKRTDNSFSGTIINIGSISATVVSTNRSEYCISKAGFSMHSKIWAVWLAKYGISVYEVRPGIIRTDMTSAAVDKYDKMIEQGLNIQPRWGMPGDVARSVLSLADGHFPFSTGEVFMVDGGLTIQRL